MGDTRRDPATGDIHHYDDNGRMVGISWEDKETGDVQFRSLVQPQFAYVPSGPYVPSVWERVRWGWVPAAMVFGAAVGLWSSDYISGIEVFVYPALTWALFAVGVRAGKSPWAVGFGLWAVMVAFLFVRGMAGAG